MDKEIKKQFSFAPTYAQQKLLDLMREWHLTYKDVADCLGITEQTVKNWLIPLEHKKHANPPLHKIQRLRDRLSGDI
jgi:DNA-binding transcriptional regulator YiaG